MGAALSAERGSNGRGKGGPKKWGNGDASRTPAVLLKITNSQRLIMCVCEGIRKDRRLMLSSRDNY